MEEIGGEFGGLDLQGLSGLVVSVGVAGLLLQWGRGLSGSMTPKKCPNCQTRLSMTLRRLARFCPYCGEQLVKGGYCKECKIYYGTEIRYCPIHGKKLE